MPKPLHYLTVATLDESPVDIDAMAKALGKSSVTLAIYSDAELARHLKAVIHRQDLKVSARPAKG
ncbi:hypothetical protein [Parafrankia sp. FMc2]|uniref:hypothetical protein n=1 Tax=Parafrankia sp. FMc2 TaxID=3233196 RepID=UPI0034D3A06E